MVQRVGLGWERLWWNIHCLVYSQIEIQMIDFHSSLARSSVPQSDLDF